MRLARSRLPKRQVDSRKGKKLKKKSFFGQLKKNPNQPLIKKYMNRKYFQKSTKKQQ